MKYLYPMLYTLVLCAQTGQLVVVFKFNKTKARSAIYTCTMSQIHRTTRRRRKNFFQTKLGIVISLLFQINLPSNKIEQKAVCKLKKKLKRKAEKHT